MPGPGQQQCEMDEFFISSLQGTQRLNPGLKLPYNRQATVTLADGTVTELRRCESRVQLYFKCIACKQGCQHYKKCQPIAVSAAADLLCPFCASDTLLWRWAGKALVVAAESVFMQLLLGMGVSSLWCHQVAHPCWTGRFDFYNLQQDVLVQIDDSTHYQQYCLGTVALRDLRCSSKAFQAAVALVRVHVIDLQRPDIVFAAIDTAAAQRAVVFTAGFNIMGFQHVLNLHQQLSTTCRIHIDAYGNTVFEHAV